MRRYTVVPERVASCPDEAEGGPPLPRMAGVRRVAKAL
jgi:hypothetical protein